MNSLTDNAGAQDSCHRSSRLLREAWLDRNLIAAEDKRNAEILAEALRLSSQLVLLVEASLDDENQEAFN